MTVLETGKQLDQDQKAFNELVNRVELVAGNREAAGVLLFKPKELLVAMQIAEGRDVVRDPKAGRLIQLPKLFAGPHEVEYLSWQGLPALIGCAEPKDINIYFFYQVFSLSCRMPVCIIGLKKKSETLADLQYFSLSDLNTQKDCRTVVIGERMFIKPAVIRSADGETVGNKEALLWFTSDLRFQDNPNWVRSYTLEEVWRG